MEPKRPDPDAYKRRHAIDLVNRVSPTNRSAVRRYLLRKEGNGARPATIAMIAKQLYHLDRLADARPFGELSPENVSSILAEYANEQGTFTDSCGKTRRLSGRSASSTRVFATTIKAFLVDSSPTGELGRSMRAALKRVPSLPKVEREVLTDVDLARLLAELDSYRPRRRALMYAALVSLLWDSGCRISEALALRIRDITFSDDGRSARVSLPTDEPGLKTGPRKLFVAECVPALRLWVAFILENAPDVGAGAYLFALTPGQGDVIGYKTTSDQIARSAQKAGIKLHIHSHLFRHTRATRAARKGWKEAQLRSHFGWGPKSEMPAYYVHLAESDMEERVRADANGVTLAGPTSSTADLAEALKKLSATLDHLGKRAE